MKAFWTAVIGCIVISVGAALVLQNLDYSVGTKMVGEGARVK